MKVIGVVDDVKIVKTSLCPKGYWMSFFGVILTTGDKLPSRETVNHEKIHFAQSRELLWIPFYIIYCFEYLFRIFQYKFNHNDAYMNISFEREAYENDCDFTYLCGRKHFSQWRKQNKP